MKISKLAAVAIAGAMATSAFANANHGSGPHKAMAQQTQQDTASADTSTHAVKNEKQAETANTLAPRTQDVYFGH
jgi:uncharacterized membrane protein YebE (DUF533 family)